MIIVLKPDTTREQMDHIIEKLTGLGLKAHVSAGTERTVIGAIGDERILRTIPLEAFPGVEKVLPILKPFKLASRDFKQENSVIRIGGAEIGGRKLVVMAGPCAVESREQLLEIAGEVKGAGAAFIRGGAFKPRTSPYSFQGLEEEGLKYLAEARQKTGLPVVTEVMDPRDIELIVKYADVLQIGARNMQNFRLLKEVGTYRKPVLLKRGISATIKEWLMSAEYIMSEGNHDVILCERGIRTYETETRNTLDLSAVPVLKQLTHLPVIVDPSHAVGKWELVPPMARAAVAAGADGLLIEVHSNPEEALCDGEQSLKPKMFRQLMSEMRVIAQAVGRDL
ncbi:MAG: 3-deoxy-7-phosphoheptulonate synthase [Nitrospirae bacterium GWC2_57_13]|jgi:3-deoxy-7-phosphoheptulonate synthase|nr:MAG: 3-deoxy-7-phosphoheptulonate synthase [Nitrospirae bacterium GWC2_57_13]OGW46539.1 MAG: 3-deoxy-7-phosphoheptulonate synthase [Nitrospirae bacterium GWD2_57_8]